MNPWVVVGMMVVSGGLMAFQAPINARLGSFVGTFQSSLISFLVGTAALAVLVATTGQGQLSAARQASGWHFLGGLIGAVFVTTTLLAAPAIGVTGMIVAALAGQIVVGLLIDTFGWVGVAPKPFDPYRVAGLGFLIVAVVLLNWNSWYKKG